MSILQIGLIAVGVVLIAIGYSRARGPWQRYQGLKTQESNIARYESWRGGLRDSGPTGASVAMEMARKQARDGAIVLGVGVTIAILGFFVS